MAFTFQQLLEFPTEDEALDELIELLGAVGFDTTNWTQGSWQTKFLRIGAYVYSKIAERSASIAKNTTVSTAEGEALTTLAENYFDIDRVFGTKTVGTFALELDVDQGPYTVAAKDLRVTDGNVVFVNQGQFSLTQNTNIVTASFEAEAVGTAYNLANGSTLRLITALNGVSVKTDPDSGTTSWITNLGTEDEEDSRLIQRCTTKWSTLATNETVEERVINTSLSASAAVTKVFVNTENPDGPGTFRVYCGGALIPSPSGDLTDVYNALTGTFMDGANRVSVLAASASYFDKNITAYYKPAYTSAQVSASIESAIDNLISSSSIGGETFGPLENIFNTNDIVQALETLPSIRKVTLDSYTDYDLIDGTGTPGMISRPIGGYGSLLTLVKVTES